MTLLYEAAEDSYFLEQEVKKQSKGKSVLDMGSGSGIIAVAAKEAGAKSVLAVDINPDAIKLIQSKEIKARVSNLFSKIKQSEKFDLIIFNPPYLPEDKREPKESSRATSGGKRGDEIIIRFLKQAKPHLNKDGKILLLLSSLTPKNEINLLMKELNLKSKAIASKKLFFEELEVLELGNNK